MSIERFGGVRFAIANEAARLMYEESVKQYFTAKRMAAKRLFGHTGGKRARYRPADLPSNGEIRDALLALAALAEGSRRTRRLFAMRVVALETMRALAGFEPRLIGSVSTGHIRRGSDIDLHVFTTNIDAFEARLRELGWTFEREIASIQKFGEIRDYLHVHIVDVFPIETTVYEPRELRFRPKSSTDGKPIVRLGVAALEALLAREHAESWARYLEDETIDGLDEELSEADADVDDAADVGNVRGGDEAGRGGAQADDGIAPPTLGRYDGILLDGAIEPIAFPEPGEEDDPWQVYDPLPGFSFPSPHPATGR